MTIASTRTSRRGQPRGAPGERVPADRWLLPAAACTTFGAGLALFCLPLRGVRLGALNGLGLISVLPVASLTGLALIVVSFVAMLARRRPATAVLSVMLVAVVFCLDGVTGLIEPLPRFPTAYQVAGFVNYVSQTGKVEPGLAAYFSWPGFFALIAFVTGAAGVHSLLPLMTWWPAAIDTLLLVPFLLLTRALRITWRARWLAALLFCLGNWVGQDYFSPQSFNFLLYLVFLAILLTWFSGYSSGRARAGGQSSGRAARIAGEVPARPITTPQRAFLLTLVILIFVVSTLSHQLTPFLEIVACAGLVLAGRCGPRGLPVLFAVILVGWISYGTVAYWSGHESTIFGSLGQLADTFEAGVNNRVIGTPIHQLADEGRIGLAALMTGMAVLGLVRRWYGGVSDRVLVVLFVAPLTVAGLQNYGGEIWLRVYMFALPAVSVLAACLFFPGTHAGRSRSRSRLAGRVPAAVTLIAAGLVTVGLAVLFMVARYGNEAFEQTPPSEYAAMNYIYDHDDHGTAVLWISDPAGSNATPQMPWAFRDIAQVRFVSGLAPHDPARLSQVVATLRGLGRGAFLITTHTESMFINQTAGFPVNWEGEFRAALSADPALRLVRSGRDAAVYQARLPASAPRATAGPVAASPSRWTIWSPIGLGALALALLLVGSREFLRECVPSRRWLRKPLAIASLPVLALLLCAVAERFVLLS